MADLPVEEVADRFKSAGIAYAFDRGLLNSLEFSESVSRLLDREFDIATVRRAWCAVIGAVDTEMIRAVLPLAQQKRLLLASNTDVIHWPLVRDKLAAVGLKAPAVLSFQLGLRKPSREFFNAVVARYSGAKGETGYIDDQAVNVDAAREAGLHATIHIAVSSSVEWIHSHFRAGELSLRGPQRNWIVLAFNPCWAEHCVQIKIEGRAMTKRLVWTEKDVANVCGAEFAARTYLEQRDVRDYLERVANGSNIQRACEVGAGYGRLTVVLNEFCDHTVAFEREPALAVKGSYLHPTIEFRLVDSLSVLPAQNDEFDVALSFTVLQHLTDSFTKEVLIELRRIVREGGYVLLCEESNDHYLDGDPSQQETVFTIGRSVERYKEWLSPLRLVDLSARHIERCPVGPEVGMYMLFRKWPEPG
jgi:HAD superfamily hydrolase (TIGR01509 family)